MTEETQTPTTRISLEDAEELRLAIGELAVDGIESDALLQVARIKKIEDKLSSIRAALLPQANASFQALQLGAPDKKQWDVGDIATVSKYATRSTWTYPAPVVKLAVDLKAAQKAAQNDGTASKQTSQPDATKNAFFALTLK